MQIEKIKQQAEQTIQIVREAAQHVSLTYFYQIWSNYWACIPVSDLPFVLVTDTDIPELYIRACGAIPIYLFGGSYYEDPLTDQLFPPICDPVTGSMTRMLLSGKIPALLKEVGVAHYWNQCGVPYPVNENPNPPAMLGRME